MTAHLSAQLVRPTGVRALLLVLIGGSDSDDDVDVRKLEMIRRVVETRPDNLPEEVSREPRSCVPPSTPRFPRLSALMQPH